MSEPAKKIRQNPEGYSPKSKPEILRMAEKINGKETTVEKVSDFCSIVERAEFSIIGINVPVSFESQGYSEGGDFNDYYVAKNILQMERLLF